MTNVNINIYNYKVHAHTLESVNECILLVKSIGIVNSEKIAWQI